MTQEIGRTTVDDFGRVGRLTVGTTVLQLTNQEKATKGITIKADTDNAGIIYVGFSTGVTTATGFPLLADESINLEIRDGSAIYVVSDQASQELAWIML